MEKSIKLRMTEIQKAYLIGRNEAFNGYTGTHMYGELNYNGSFDSLEKALNKIIESQPMMRARIFDESTFLIDERLDYKILKIAKNFDDEDEIKKRRNLLSHKKYTAEDFPLFDIQAVGVEERYTVLISIDLLIADGLSLYQFMDDLNQCVKDDNYILENRQADLIYMVDYYFQQRNSRKYIKAREYYLERLNEIFEAPQLHYKIQNIKEGRFKRKEYEIEKDKYNILIEKAKEHNSSTTEILLLLYSMVLAHWSRNSRFSINTTTFTRPNEKKYLKVMGDFTTSFLLQVNLDLEKDIESNLKAIRHNMFSALRYRYYEVPEIVRDMDRNSKVPVMPVVFTSMLFENNDVFNEDISLNYWISQTPQVFLDFQAKNINGGLNISWDYMEEVFDENTIDIMFEEFVFNLENYISKYKDVLLLYREYSKEKYLKLYSEYNLQLTDPRVATLSLQEHFNRCVVEIPNNVFFVLNDREYTYLDIKNLTDPIIDKIICEKVKVKKNKVRIAFSAEKDLNSMLYIIAALRTGDSFCAINSDYSSEKTKHILDSLENYIYINGEIIETAYKSNKEVNKKESYILYTSGTTGEPKGIIISEEAALNTVYTMINQFNVTSKDVLLNISNLYFDLSIFDIFASIIKGIPIYMVDPFDSSWRENNKLLNSVTVWNSTPMLAKEFLIKNNFSNLRQVFLSGDFVSPMLIKQLYEKYKNNTDFSVVALGGATEASIWSNYFNCSKDSEICKVPYGKPLLGQQLYVVKDTLELCDIGVMGEICISGKGLADGYISEEQTKDAFVYHDILKKRIYKTGDLGYLGDDLNIYIIGRVKNEIKHNGYRIDLKEIEKNVNNIKGITNSHVFIEKLNNNKTKLICVYCTNYESLSSNNIIDNLMKEVPSYMIPTNYYRLIDIPLTANGKVDLNAIKEFIKAHEEVCSLNEEEKQLVSIWRSVISEENFAEPNSPHDNFFDLGGESLKLLEAKEKIQKHYNINMSLQDFMNHSSIRNQLALIKTLELAADIIPKSNQLILLRKGEDKNRNIVFIHAGSGEVAIYEKLSSFVESNYNVYAIRYDKNVERCGPVNISFKEIAKVYNDILQELNEIDFIGGWCIGGTIAYELSLISNDKYKNIFMLNSLAPLINGIEKYSIDYSSEYALINRYLKLNISDCEQFNVDNVWKEVIKEIEKSPIKRKILVQILPKNLTRLMPNFKDLPAKELIYYLNLFRSFERARYLYENNTKTNANIFYFNALDEEVENYKQWEQLTENYRQFWVKGDHVSIFSDKNVSSLGKAINIMIEDIM